MRVGKLNLAEKEYPVVYSAWVQQQLENDGVKDPSDLLTDRARLFHNFVYLLELMLRAGAKYAALTGGAAADPPDAETLSILIGIDDTETIMNEVMLPVLTGERNVEAAEPDDAKNAETAPTGP